MKLIDFTDIEIYPETYWCETKRGKKVFGFNSFVIENISRQKDILLTKKTTLMLGDIIKVDTHFGHNTAPKHLAEKWVDMRVTGEFQVLEIIPRPETDDIVLKVKGM